MRSRQPRLRPLRAARPPSLAVLLLLLLLGNPTTALGLRAAASAPVGQAITPGTIVAWGNDGNGQLGDGLADNPSVDPTPKAVPGVGGVVAITAGSTHSLALRADGTVLAWGNDERGALGDGTVSMPFDNPTPKAVPGVGGIVAIAAGNSHSLALQADGTVLAWGWDASAQLGDGTWAAPDFNPTPRAVPGVDGVVAIAAGTEHSLALRADGTILSWGLNSAGQLGYAPYGFAVANPTPRVIPGVGGVVAIAAGGGHSLALKGDGTVLAWGSDRIGELGDGTVGTPDDNPTARAVPGVDGVVAIAAGGGHNLALKADGSVLAWGLDRYGELGDGTVGTPDVVPTARAVLGVDGVTAIAAAVYNLALRADGTVLAWGIDSIGQLGDGTVAQPYSEPTPKVVPGVGGAVAVAAGGGHGLVLVGARFGDLGGQPPEAVEAINQLAGRGIINGCDSAATPPRFCPADPVLRAQMAALIVRAMPGWAGEAYANTFTDQGQVDAELWRRVATLQHYGVANGYNDCPAMGLVAPCYGPTDPVNRAQAISFVTRAMVKKGYWQDQPVNPGLYGGALAGTGHEQDASTYWHYTAAKGGVPEYPQGGGFPVRENAPRAWFARLLWTALQGSPAAP